ncbi:MAG: UDP-N-acetylglucosamine 2-epimerase [Candidatus Marinimicrobia bacterium]|nr:UDP-N-acetylglucosamine 2-epimerase [Candidatus Neomarinimicrobiota bacterium]
MAKKKFVVIGTKAQLIKMAPIMAELQKRKIDYDFIFTGQHKETIEELIGGFQLKKPDYILYKGKDITKIHQMIFWFIKCIVHTLKNKKKIFGKNGNVVLIHGDAISALLGATIAKISGLKVAYIEAGLRSFDTFNPFPEEITRRLVSFLSDYHFCPGEFAYKNSQKYRGIKINTKANTLLDSLRLVIRNDNSIQVDIPKEKYCLVSIHRFENIFNKAQFSFILEILEEISRQIKVLLILHKPTKEKLKEYGFFQELRKNPNIELRPRYNYFKFIKLLCATEFVITDGGSNQEECCYLGKPCLLMRKTTERKEGLGQNVVISKYDRKIIKDFTNNYQNYRLDPLIREISPSKIIVECLTKWKI